MELDLPNCKKISGTKSLSYYGRIKASQHEMIAEWTKEMAQDLLTEVDLSDNCKRAVWVVIGELTSGA